MPIELPRLDYTFDALEPHLSSTTLKTHHGKHHKTYVEKANKLLEGTPLSGATIEEVVRQAAQRKASDEKMAKLYNNAGQAWNHSFYWRSLRPPGGAKPAGAFADAIRSAFGGQDKLEERLKTAAADQFGSGWAWLVLDGSTLRGSRPRMLIHRWWRHRNARCSRSTCGSTPTTSTTTSAGRSIWPQ